MSLIDELKIKREKTIDEKAIEFAEKMKVAIVESAEKGYSGYRYKINNDFEDKHIFRSKSFAKKVEKLMDGVSVKYEVVEKKSFFTSLVSYEHYIVFDWNK